MKQGGIATCLRRGIKETAEFEPGDSAHLELAGHEVGRQQLKGLAGRRMQWLRWRVRIEESRLDGLFFVRGQLAAPPRGKKAEGEAVG